MPANNVDLTAVLPVLQEAAKPFVAAFKEIDALPQQVKPNEAGTQLGNWIGVRVIPLLQLRKLLEAVEAVEKLAGVKTDG